MREALKVVIVRHGIAAEPDASGDDVRPLTEEGRRELAATARRLSTLVTKVDRVWSSPLLRTVQTAEILHREAGWPRATTKASLKSEALPRVAIEELRTEPASATIALVGHEPHVSGLLAQLIDRRQERPRGFGRGDVAVVAFPGVLIPGHGTLEAFLSGHG